MMSKDKIVLYIALLLSFAAFSVSYLRSAAVGGGTNLKEEIAELSARLNKVDDQYKALSKAVLSLSFDYYTSRNTTASFSPTDTRFQLLSSPYGNLLVSLTNIKKYGDGYKLIFSFGNPTSLIIEGVKGSVKWGPKIDWTRYYSDKAYKSNIDQNTQSKNFAILQDLYPGSWNQEAVVIGPATEEEIGNIVLSNISADSVKMHR
ncbi:MAG: DUF3251 domain-containing protein [Alphaproteobacteria bacterium]|nr:DUF3251 domain-containing protein [Alphaproteobacteria bacterium]